ncbi:hypothetical protein BDW59DRAFT_159481 [Aspergillus cavernicola]|uniref:CFEM domain-containing protein n=1 Tax=Aspergillus cavernicola TaxID=176166 RepID=A0ABR4ILP0_9EURO
MKLQFLALALVACLSSAAAQGMPGLPACAQDCATGAIPDACGLIDVECICAERTFIDDMACCVGKSCQPEDQDAALEFANGICGGAGITDLPQSATCRGDSTSTTTATDTTSDEATTTTSSGSSPSEAATTTTDGELSSSETITETPTSSETAAGPEQTDGAALLLGKEVSLLAGIAAGVAFLM